MANACGRPKTEAQHEWAERWLSSSRLSSYLDLCDGNIDRTLELHEWNLMLGFWAHMTDQSRERDLGYRICTPHGLPEPTGQSST